MNVDFVPYQEALELKALGFDEPCFVYWVYDNVEITFSTSHNRSGWSMIGFKNNQMNKKAGLCTAPTFSQAFRWFREKYDLQYTITWNKNYPKTPYGWEVRKSWRDEPIRPYGISGMSATHEEAELACLRKLIEIIKSQKE